MDLAAILESGGALWSPVTFALLVGLATYLVWLALVPRRSAQGLDERLDGYLTAQEIRRAVEPRRSLLRPLLRRLIRFLGRFAPKRGLEAIERRLVQAGRPGGLSVLDFLGLRLLLTLLLGGGYFLFLGSSLPFFTAVRNGVLIAVMGYSLPPLWLHRQVHKRQNEVLRALPDALDMLTIGVEAGLAFESALLRVSQKWDNALTREFHRAVSEMRVGVGRNEALQRMVDRTGVDELGSFVATLIQSSQLGISISEILHGQAAQMRLKRRQRAEELARQAGVKMVFPLVFLVFPALFVVILGPLVPRILQALNSFAGSL